MIPLYTFKNVPFVLKLQIRTFYDHKTPRELPKGEWQEVLIILTKVSLEFQPDTSFIIS